MSFLLLQNNISNDFRQRHIKVLDNVGFADNDTYPVMITLSAHVHILRTLDCLL